MAIYKYFRKKIIFSQPKSPMNKNFKDFFEFSKKELNGLLVFSILLVLVAFAPLIYSHFNPPKSYDYSAFKKEVELFRASAVKKQHFKYNSDVEDEVLEQNSSVELFAFNPNNLPASDWKRLGLSDKQIRVIKNYELKGGRFYKKEDLRKIYSIKPDDYARLEPLIDIPESPSAYKATYESGYKKAGEKKLMIVELNSADSSQLEQLNGIGPAFASRIIKYRNRLGGFCRKEQLREVYGLDSILYQKLQHQITLNPGAIKQISVNTATFDEFKKHPYLTYKQMNAIIKYRNQHGSYSSVADMKAIAILNDNVINRIAPYLLFNPK